MSSSRLLTWLLAALLTVTSRCIGYRKPLPASRGWKSLLAHEYLKFDPAITADYKQYISQLPLTERAQVLETSVHFFGNSNGQHAVSFDISHPALFGEVIRTHALIYDKNNKRIKVIKRKTDRSLII
jgi:hypothetical protein